MRRLLVYLAALLLAVIMSYAIGTEATKERSTPKLTAHDIPLVTTPLELRHTVNCEGNSLSALTYWPGLGERTYTARFTAIHGGSVRISVGGNLHTITIPDDEISRDFSVPVTLDWADDVNIEIRVDAQATPGNCPQRPLLIWNYGLYISP